MESRVNIVTELWKDAFKHRFEEQEVTIPWDKHSPRAMIHRSIQLVGSIHFAKVVSNY